MCPGAAGVPGHVRGEPAAEGGVRPAEGPQQPREVPRAAEGGRWGIVNRTSLRI